MPPILKKISKKGIPLLLAFGLIVGAVGMVPVNAAVEDRTAGTAVGEVAADQAKAAGKEAEPPADEKAGPEQPAKEEEPADEQPEAEEQEQTQFDARAKKPVKLPADWDEKMAEFFPDENLRRIVKEKFESGEAYGGSAATTEAFLARCKSFTLKIKNLCEGDPANVKDLTGIEKLGQRRDSRARIIVTYSSPCMDMSLWETLAQKLPKSLPRGGLAVTIDYVGVIPTILTASGIEYYGSRYPGEINLPKLMGFSNTQEFFTETVKLNYVRANDPEKDVTIDLGVQKRKSVGSADLEGIVNAGHPEVLAGRNPVMDPQDPDKYAEQIPGVMELVEKNQDGNYVKLRLFGKTLYDPDGNLYAFGYGLNQYDNFGNGSTTTNPLSYSYRYPFEPVYYSALNWEIQSQLYSGFKFKKTNSDGAQSLAGAQYIVSRKKQAVYSKEEANALSKSWLAGTPKYEKAADGSVDYSRPIYETDAAGQPVYEYLQQEGQKNPYQAAVFTTDQSKAHTYTTGEDGTFTADMIPAGSLQTATYTNADKTSSIVSTTYYVKEIKAPDGYELSTASPTEIKVTGNTSGIRLEAEGGHGDTIKDVYTKGVELKPDFSEIAETEGTPETNRYKMNVVDKNSPKTEQHATVFIRNAEDEPFKVDEWDMETDERDVKYITINYAKNGTDDDRYDILQQPGYKVVDLEGNVVPGLENIASVEDLSKGINKVIIDGNLAQTEKDSYNIVAAQADKQELVYYDTKWKTNYQTADKDNNHSIAGVQKNDPLPVSIQFSAKKIFTGGQFKDRDFKFTLAPTATVDGDPVTAPVEGYTDAMGKISFAGFPKFSYTKSGTYTYTLTEEQNWYQGNTADDITFDASTHTVVVTVTEKESAPGVTNGLTATVTVDGNKIGQAVTSVNCDKADVFELATFTNTLAKKDMGSLTVTKKVSGDLGDQNADWHFTVTLDDKTINATYGDMTFVDGVAQIVLKHGESKTATDLPAGVKYTVVEKEANQNGYATTATDDTGTIEKDVTKTAAFTNTYNSPLPDTGGAGTTLFTLSGLGLIAVAVGALMYQYIKRRKRGGRVM